jgi:hypothetical protein
VVLSFTLVLFSGIRFPNTREATNAMPAFGNVPFSIILLMMLTFKWLSSLLSDTALINCAGLKG